MSKKTEAGDLLSDLSPRARTLLRALNAARAKLRRLQEQRDALEAKLMDAMSDASAAQSAYYTCLSMDEAQAAEAGRRAAIARSPATIGG